MEGSTVFFAWQNDTRSDLNRYFIRDALKEALATLHRDNGIEECPRLDHDTEGVPGTPSIADTIFEKISKTTVFVADVTLIGRSTDKLIPNPNVMIELGYALRAVSSDRVILVMNTAYGGPDQLPFDLRNRRFPIRFSLEEGTPKEQKRAVFNKLTAQLSHAIGAILGIPAGKVPRHNLKLHISPTRHGKRQFAQIRLFNGGPGPVFVESWWLRWGPGGRRSFHSSISCVRGKLPVRLEEQSAAEVLVEIGDNLEDLTGIGVLGGDGNLFESEDCDLVMFKHDAISSRLPAIQSEIDKARALVAPHVEIVARVSSPVGDRPHRLEVEFKNESEMPVTIKKAQLSWNYTPPRQLPSRPGKPGVAEVSGAVGLSAQSHSNVVGPGQKVVYTIDDNLYVCLVELLRGDVRDESIAIEFVTSAGFCWKASMEEIPSVVRAVAEAVLKKLHD